MFGGDTLDRSMFHLKNNESSEPIIVYSCTDKGRVRQYNDDYHGYFIANDKEIMNKRGSIFAIADGVGGCAAGNVASAEAVNVLLQEYYFGAHSEKIPERFKNAFQHTAIHLYDLSTGTNTAFHNMKCTLSALLIKHDKFFITHVGDSKIFLIRSNKMIQLTKDHSLVGKLLRLGFITQEEARVHPNKNIILKALGDRPIMPPDFYSGKVVPGDIFCLVTDGMLVHATEDELNEFIQNDNSEEGLKRTVGQLNDRGGFDNMTIMTVKVEKITG
jgi:protein phosphatase